MITRDVDARAVADLVLSPPRATLAAAVGDEIIVLPVAVVAEAPQEPASSPRVVRVPRGSPDLAGRNVVVVTDDGPQWFRLRSLTVRGTADAIGECTYRVVPTRSVAWDYGSLRQAPTPSVPSNPRRPVFSIAGEDDDVRPVAAPNLEAVARRTRVMILASRSPKGTPFAVPLWFVLHSGRIYAATSASSWTVGNVAQSPEAALLFGGERRGDAERLVVRGHAQAVRGRTTAGGARPDSLALLSGSAVRRG